MSDLVLYERLTAYFDHRCTILEGMMSQLDDQIQTLTTDLAALSTQLQAAEDAARKYSQDIINQLTALRAQFGAANPALAAALDQFQPLHDRLARDMADVATADANTQPAPPPPAP